eukprot:5100748-Karenia_brevis.AAC.1
MPVTCTGTILKKTFLHSGGSAATIHRAHSICRRVLRFAERTKHGSSGYQPHAHGSPKRLTGGVGADPTQPKPIAATGTMPQ